MATTVYVDADDFKKTLVAEGSTFLDDDIDLALQAASEGIDRAQGRSYGLGEDENEVRLYDSVLGETLYIDDLVDLVSLRVDRSGNGSFDTWAVDTDFSLRPPNAAGQSQPFNQIRVHRSETFPCDSYAVVEVTGQFGWPTPPASVIAATGIIAAQLLKRAREAPFGVVSISSETAAYIARNDPQVAFLLHGLGRRQLFV